jgi:hypothetical protein
MALTLLSNGHYALQSDQVTYIMLDAMDAAGAIVPIPAGTTFTAASSGTFAASVVFASSVMPPGSVDGSGNSVAGAPAVSASPTVLESDAGNAGGGIGLVLTDSAGLPMTPASATELFDVVPDVAAVSVGVNNSVTATTPQTPPTAPGP